MVARRREKDPASAGQASALAAAAESDGLPMSSPDIGPREREAVLEVLRSPRLSQGPFRERFERGLAGYLGVAHALALSSGTAGLHLALRVVGVKRGDRVVTSPFSFVATSNAILYLGARPVFVDVEAETGNLDPVRLAETLERESRARPKAILPVHVFGEPADMDRITAIAHGRGMAVVEDACEALGSEYKGRKVGTLGDAAVFGFFPNKQITTGEGGAVAVDRRDWADKIGSWRNQGRALSGLGEAHDELGYNYRMSEVSAAIGAVQIERIDELLSKRDRVAHWYTTRLAGIEGVSTPRPGATTTRLSWFVYCLRIDKPLDRDEVRRELLQRGVPTRVYFQPIHLQPYYHRRFGAALGSFPVAERLGATSLALPFSGVMTEGQVDRVAETLRTVVKGLLG